MVRPPTIPNHLRIIPNQIQIFRSVAHANHVLFRHDIPRQQPVVARWNNVLLRYFLLDICLEGKREVT